ncbi:MAG: hypothetical protein EHV01_003065 [Spiroplasma sp. hy2]|uniref:hypothetical protein n=1 Tax=Spiroplasma sp. hy2 TaxID=2490850 RepID=UPI0038442E5B
MNYGRKIFSKKISILVEIILFVYILITIMLMKNIERFQIGNRIKIEEKNSDNIEEPSVLESKSPKITPSRTATVPKVIHSLKGGTAVGSPSNRKASVGNPTHRRTSSRIPSGRRTNPREFPPIKPIEESGGSGPSGPQSSSASNSSNSLRKEKTVSSTSLEEQVQTSREADENLKVPKNNSETLNSQVEDENKAAKLKALEIVEEQFEEVLKIRQN